MDARRWTQIEELFQLVCDCDPRQRERLLTQGCDGDPELRHTVEALLSNVDRAANELHAAVQGGLDAVAFPLVGETISHYRILRGIDTGGMGSVYQAEDLKLGRQVALKFLAEDFARDPAALSRFEREARSASALEHPNICPIYEFGEHAGQPFLAMQLLEGHTLLELIARNGSEQPPFALAEFLSLALQIAAALDAAHRHGIVHRDIKPANIFITQAGQAKILDFGLAKPTWGEIAESAGTAMGTTAYMSPEQARGEKLDVRTDIFSFGLVLYEMATGRRAFQGATEPILHDVILRQTPVPVRRLNPTLPARLEAIIDKALAASRDARYQTAEELRADLETVKRITDGRRVFNVVTLATSALATVLIAGGAATWLTRRVPSSPAAQTSAIRSLAVLPLQNLSGDAAQDYFADALTDELITDLGQMGDLRVRSRTSVDRYKGVHRPLPQIAQELRIDAVLEGALTRSGNRVRITAQLVQAPSYKAIWDRVYETDLGNIVSLQARIAADVANEVHAKLASQQPLIAKKQYVTSPAAAEAYLRGRYYWDTRSTQGITTAIEAFGEAIREDPSFALPYAALAQVYAALPGYLAIEPRSSYEKARVAATRALELDDTLAEAHTALGGIDLSKDYDWEASERELLRAIELNPSYADAYHWHALNLMLMKKWPEAIAEIERARQLDPFSDIINANLGFVYYSARRFDDAIAAERRALELSADNAAAYEYLGLAYLGKSMYGEAAIHLRRASELTAGDPKVAAELLVVYAAQARRAEARRVLTSLQGRARREYVSSFSLAIAYLGMGDSRRALDYLERAYEERCDPLVTINVSPLFDSLHSDPRFQHLLQRIGFPAAPVIAEAIVMPQPAPRRVNIHGG